MNSLIRTLVFAFLSLNFATTGNAGDWTSIELGYQGVGKVGRWLPVRATASDLNAGDRIELQAAFTDPRGDTCVQTVAAATVEPNGTAILSGYFCVGRLEGRGELLLVSEDGNVICQQVIIHGERVDSQMEDTSEAAGQLRTDLQLYRLDVPVLLTIGEVAGIEELLRNTQAMSQNRPILKAINLSSANDLPENSRGFDVADMLLFVEDFETNQKQAGAVREWVESGGDFYCSAGENVTALLDSNVGRWLNGYFDISPESATIRDLAAFQSFVPGASRLETGRRPVPMAVVRNSQSHVRVDFLNGPLVSAQSVGTGTVTFVAVDLNQRPVDRWISLPQFYEVLLFHEKLSQTTGRSSRSSRISQSGISDLATQLMAVVDAVPEGKWTTWSILAAMAGWLLLIGPLDYLLVTRVLKRPQLTWITFPLLICLGVAYIVWGLGDDRNNTLNQIHLVDIISDKTSSKVNTRSLVSLSSARTARIDLKAEPALLADSSIPSLLMWSGRPEDVYGGMYRAGGIGLGRQKYSHHLSASNELSSMPMLVDGSRQLISEWQHELTDPVVSSQLHVSGYGLLKGSFHHSLPADLEDFIVVHGNRVYRTLGGKDGPRLAAGEVWESRSHHVAASDLKAFLNGQRLVKSDRSDNNGTRRGSSQAITPYNTKSNDPLYILSIATFYNISGGSKYVGLSQDYFRDMELSDTIRLNHAVLIGTTSTAATTFSADGNQITPNRSTTLVRLLLPVRRGQAEEMAPIEAMRDEENAVDVSASSAAL